MVVLFSKYVQYTNVLYTQSWHVVLSMDLQCKLTSLRKIWSILKASKAMTSCIDLYKCAMKYQTSAPPDAVCSLQISQLRVRFECCLVHTCTMTCLITSHHLKILDTFGNCHRPVFSLGTSQHMHKTTNLWKYLNSIGHRRCEIRMEENKKHLSMLSHKVVCSHHTRCLITGPQNIILRSRNQF